MTPQLILLATLLAALLSCSACEDSHTRDNCDQNQCETTGLTNLYSELKCRPVYQAGTCCPVRYDCNSYSSRNANKCHYDGEEYEVGAQAPSNKTSPNCFAGCNCYGGDRRPIDFICAQIECEEFFGVPLPHSSCIRQYSLEHCCSVSQYCPNNKTEGEEEVFQCEFEGNKYIKGQRFYPKDECKRCVCGEGFDGTTNGPWCADLSCSIELRNAVHLRQGCAPVYYKKHCCPIKWHCPSDDDHIIEGPNHKTATYGTVDNNDDQLTCTFGNLKFQLQDRLQTRESSKVDCSCITPPYLSCALKNDD